MKTKLIIKVKTVMLEAIEEYNLSNEKVYIVKSLLSQTLISLILQHSVKYSQ